MLAMRIWGGHAFSMMRQEFVLIKQSLAERKIMPGKLCCVQTAFGFIVLDSGRRDSYLNDCGQLSTDPFSPSVGPYRAECGHSYSLKFQQWNWLNENVASVLLLKVFKLEYWGMENKCQHHLAMSLGDQPTLICPGPSWFWAHVSNTPSISG